MKKLNFKEAVKDDMYKMAMEWYDSVYDEGWDDAIVFGMRIANVHEYNDRICELEKELRKCYKNRDEIKSKLIASWGRKTGNWVVGNKAELMQRITDTFDKITRDIRDITGSECIHAGDLALYYSMLFHLGFSSGTIPNLSTKESAFNSTVEHISRVLKLSYGGDIYSVKEIIDGVQWSNNE